MGKSKSEGMKRIGGNGLVNGIISCYLFIYCTTEVTHPAGLV